MQFNQNTYISDFFTFPEESKIQEPEHDRYRLFYHCGCDEQWTSQWDCERTDVCPSCGLEVQPERIEGL